MLQIKRINKLITGIQRVIPFDEILIVLGGCQFSYNQTKHVCPVSYLSEG